MTSVRCQSNTIFFKKLKIPSKNKDGTTTLLHRRTIDCNDAVISLEVKVSSTSVDNFVTNLKNDVVATLYQRSTNVVTTLQSLNFTGCPRVSFQHCVKVTSANALLFLRKLPL